MYRNILVATDGSDLAANAAKHGISLAKSLGAKVTAVSVSEPFPWFDYQMVPEAAAAHVQGAKQAAAKALSAIADAARAANVVCDTVHVENAYPYEAIIDAAKARDCDLIVMGSHGRRGISAVVLGSETVKVLTHSSLPILVYR